MKRALPVIALVLLGGTGAARADVTTFGVSVSIAREDKARIVDDPWMNQQIADANRLFEPLGVRFRWTIEKELPEPHGELHSRADRNALTPLTEKSGVIDVFVVRELEDVDEPGRYRMGVTWTGNGGKRFIVLARSARRTVFAHELGHLFGNGHSTVTNNLMSYSRTDGEVFLDERQQRIVKTMAAQFLATKTLIDVGPPLRVW